MVRASTCCYKLVRQARKGLADCTRKRLTCKTARPGAPHRTGGGDPAPWHSPEGLDRKVTSPYAYFEAGQLYLTRERGRDEGDTHHLNFRAGRPRLTTSLPRPFRLFAHVVSHSNKPLGAYP